MTPELLVAAGIIIIGNGAAVWVGMKSAINGLHADVEEIKDDVKAHSTELKDHALSLGRVELELQHVKDNC